MAPAFRDHTEWANNSPAPGQGYVSVRVSNIEEQYHGPNVNVGREQEKQQSSDGRFIKSSSSVECIIALRKLICIFLRPMRHCRRQPTTCLPASMAALAAPYGVLENGSAQLTERFEISKLLCKN